MIAVDLCYVQFALSVAAIVADKIIKHPGKAPGHSAVWRIIIQQYLDEGKKMAGKDVICVTNIFTLNMYKFVKCIKEKTTKE